MVEVLNSLSIRLDPTMALYLSVSAGSLRALLGSGRKTQARRLFVTVPASEARCTERITGD